MVKSKRTAQALFDKTIKRARERLRYHTLKYANEKVSDMAEDVANSARDKAVEFLYKNATPKDENSEMLLGEVANRIVVQESYTRDGAKGYFVGIVDENALEGLPLYLELGTGKMGAENPHEEVVSGRSIGWEYQYFPEHANGFFFKYNNRKFYPYLTDSDYHPIEGGTRVYQKSSGSVVTRRLKDGREIKYYRKPTDKSKFKQSNANGEIIDYGDKRIYSRKPNYNSVFSIGMKPVRYIYNAKQWVKETYGKRKG